MAQISYPIELRWSREHEDFCVEKRVYLQHVRLTRGIYGIGQTVRLTHRVVTERHATMPLCGFCSIGCHSYSASWLPGDMQVGRFCSIAPNVQIMGTQHPTRRFTSSPMTYADRFRDIAETDFGVKFETKWFQAVLPPPIVGSDVWIGEQAMLKGGIRVGDGAVVAARSVVTKDVPAYAVVGGVPAKVVRFRFPEATIERLLRLQWWRYNFIDLPPRETWDDLERFLGDLEERISGRHIHPYTPDSIDLGAELLAVGGPVTQGQSSAASVGVAPDPRRNGRG